MLDYAIVTDSTADLPVELVEELGIHVVPMSFEMNDQSYMHYSDAREMSIKEFYDHIRQGKTSKTTLINYATYMEIFEPILKEGKDILYIAFSSGLSGTYNNSQIVIQELLEAYPERKIISIDSISASVGEGLLVYNAVQKKKEGLSLGELKEWVEQNRDRVCHWFTVEDLHHLKRGGRVSTMEALLGSTLKIRPVLSVDHEGRLMTVSKVRGQKRSLEVLLDKMLEEGVDLINQTVIIGHGDCLENAEKLADLIKEANIVNDIIICDIGPIIGTHTGSGMIGLAFMGNKSI
jgi:DegV family protein with EDD domain